MSTFNPPSLDTIRQNWLRDLLSANPAAATDSDSDNYIRATVIASAIEGLYEHQSWIFKQIFPDQADVEYMEMHAARKGLSYKAATYATGFVTFTGQSGSVIPVGTQLKRADDTAYQTTAAATIDGSGTCTVAAQAVTAGANGNASTGVLLTVQSAPSGVQSQAVISSMLSGTDKETAASLLARLLDILRHPPAGGNPYDYKRWALEVDGVTGAYVFPWRRGAGTVDVAITSAGGLPSAGLISQVQSHIDSLRPAGTKGTLVFAPSVLTVDVSVQVKVAGTTLANITPLIQSAMESYFAGITPGDTVIKSKLETLISDLTGVVDRAITLPAANVVPTNTSTVLQWCRLGAVTVSAM
ncbi:baseplate J/gp47 family protein [Leeia sp. TBRC 13508]|uniref:Baseplate J/gp47 family protein n=1 Tax=Leeia speluncae TaxID=2884804 RepID=A0ABS8D275_9NEIS|nr:baseplate J/gp47 family protein [Leeia speluncae]MCB6182303.1 baseplate J/gp47 family protein [Leeia speluncae]